MEKVRLSPLVNWVSVSPSLSEEMYRKRLNIKCKPQQYIMKIALNPLAMSTFDLSFISLLQTCLSISLSFISFCSKGQFWQSSACFLNNLMCLSSLSLLLSLLILKILFIYIQYIKCRKEKVSVFLYQDIYVTNNNNNSKNNTFKKAKQDSSMMIPL